MTGATAVPKVEVKGQSFLGMHRALETFHGSSALDRLYEVLGRNPLATRLRDKLILSGSWYPIAEYCEFLQSIHRALGSEPNCVGMLSYRAVAADFDSGVYRLLSTLLPKSMVAKVPATIHGLYYRNSKVSHERMGKVGVVLRFYDTYGFTDLAWQDLVWGSRAAFEALGGEKVVHEIQAGGGTGDTECRVYFHWQSTKSGTITADIVANSHDP